MKKKILNFIERAVIQSLKRGMRKVNQIHFDTSLPPHIIQNTLSELIDIGLVQKKDQGFILRVCAEHSSLWRSSEVEVLSLISQAYKGKEKGLFNFQNVNLTKDDMTEYERLSFQMNKLVIDSKRNKYLPTKNSRFLFWGQIGQTQITF